MSLASRTVGIPGLEVERVHRQKGIEIWAKLFYRLVCLHCGADKLRIKATYTRTIKHTGQGNQVMIWHLPNLHRVAIALPASSPCAVPIDHP